MTACFMIMSSFQLMREKVTEDVQDVVAVMGHNKILNYEQVFFLISCFLSCSLLCKGLETIRMMF